MRIVFALLSIAVAGHHHVSVADPSAGARLNEPGSESKPLVSDVGTWEVIATLRPTPDAKPIVAKQLVAERVLIGGYLQETMHPEASSKDPAFTRIDYLTFDRVDGRWQYVSMDTRMPVGIMPATSFDRGNDKTVTFEFAPLAFAGMGENVEGVMIRSNMVITRDSKDHQTKEQHWIRADGTGREWVAVRYEYRRKS